jgi:hypothetical protein
MQSQLKTAGRPEKMTMWTCAKWIYKTNGMRGTANACVWPLPNIHVNRFLSWCCSARWAGFMADCLHGLWWWCFKDQSGRVSNAQIGCSDVEALSVQIYPLRWIKIKLLLDTLAGGITNNLFFTSISNIVTERLPRVVALDWSDMEQALSHWRAYEETGEPRLIRVTRSRIRNILSFRNGTINRVVER